MRRVDADGKVTTVIGRAGQRGLSVGALPAGLDTPTGFAITPQGLVILSRLALLRVVL